MERMKELTVNIQDECEGKVIYRTKLYTEEEYKKLEEENKKLNEEIQRFKDNAMQDMREITELEIENKKLKEKLEKREKDWREGNIVDARNG